MTAQRRGESWGPPRGVRLLALSALVFAAYSVIGALTLTLGQTAGLASPVWPAAGLAFAVVYAWGWRITPAVLLGSVAGNTAFLTQQDSLTGQILTLTFFIGVGAVLQAIAGAKLVTAAIGRHPTLSTGGQIVVFLLLAGPVASIVNATVGAAAQWGLDLLSSDQLLVSWVTWWAGDAIGVVVFAPLVLMLIPDQRETWQGRRLRVALPALVAVSIFIALFVQADIQSRNEREAQVNLLAAEAADVLARDMARHQEALEGVASFFESSDEVNIEEFNTYADSVLERFDNLQALSWNPLITAEQLDAFEEYQRSVQGLIDYTVTQRDAAGNLIPVTYRPEYVPVAYIEPIEGNRPALGFDINSNPIRRVAIEQARATGLPSATGPIELVQEAGSQQGMLALVPVYSDDVIEGFAVGVYRLGDLLRDSFANPAWDDIQINLVDVTEATNPQEVAVRPAASPAIVDLATEQDVASASTRINVYGRTWQLKVTPVNGELVSPDRFFSLRLDLLALIVLTLLQAFILLLTGQQRIAVRQAELARREANTDALTGLWNRRAFLQQLQSINDRSLAENSTSVLLYLDLDNFKAVNDRGGHLAGDELLTKVAHILTTSVRSRDIVARLGGDEFAVIVNNVDLDRGVQIAEKLNAEVTAITVDGPDGPLGVGVSIGATAMSPQNHATIDELIRQADEAGYEAKRSGGGVQSAHVTSSPEAD